MKERIRRAVREQRRQQFTLARRNEARDEAAPYPMSDRRFSDFVPKAHLLRLYSCFFLENRSKRIEATASGLAHYRFTHESTADFVKTFVNPRVTRYEECRTDDAAFLQGAFDNFAFRVFIWHALTSSAKDGETVVRIDGRNGLVIVKKKGRVSPTTFVDLGVTMANLIHVLKMTLKTPPADMPMMNGGTMKSYIDEGAWHVLEFRMPLPPVDAAAMDRYKTDLFPAICYKITNYCQ